MPVGADGTVYQSALIQEPEDVRFSRDAVGLHLGIILTLQYPDDPSNSSSAHSSAPRRGSYAEADVLIVSGRDTSTWLIPKVVVTPDRPSGVWQYSERWPRPALSTYDGKPWDGTLNIPVQNLDGDWCVVAFLDGTVRRPFVIRWWQNPGNRVDPATAGIGDGLLDQGYRWLEKFAGVDLLLADDGTIRIDMTGANPSPLGGEEQPLEPGGDLLVDAKQGRKVEINFNNQVPLPTSLPSAPQPNPPPTMEEAVRKDVLTRFTMTKDRVEAIAGEVGKLAGRADEDSVELGLNPTAHAVMGEATRDYLKGLAKTVNDLIDFVNRIATAHSMDPFTGRASDPPDEILSKQVRLE